MNCRFCGNPLSCQFINLGHTPVSNDFLTEKQLNEPEIQYPLNVLVCEKCFLVQVDEFKKANDIFDNNYAYFSSYSTTWLEHCKKYAEMISSRLELNKNSLVIEVASNDGYLLHYFKEKSIPVLGIEPTSNTAKVAREKGIETIEAFFGEKLAKQLGTQNRKGDLVIGNNVLAHVPNINDFVKGLKLALAEKGVITIEFPHLMQLIENNQFDTIYHEHFSYLSFSTVKKIFNHHKLELFDVEEIPTHGGSLRIYAKHQEDDSKPVSKAVKDLLEREKQKGMNKTEYYSEFQKKADKIKHDFLNFLIEQKKKGKKIAAYGAAAKGNTFLNYCGIKKDLIDFVVDRSPFKQGKYLPGSHMPVVKEEVLKQEKPDYIVILPWNLKGEIIRQLDYVKGWDCKFIIAVPNMTCI